MPVWNIWSRNMADSFLPDTTEANVFSIGEHGAEKMQRWDVFRKRDGSRIDRVNINGNITDIEAVSGSVVALTIAAGSAMVFLHDSVPYPKEATCYLPLLTTWCRPYFH